MITKSPKTTASVLRITLEEYNLEAKTDFRYITEFISKKDTLNHNYPYPVCHLTAFQVIPHYINERLSAVPGFTGLFLAGVVSATLRYLCTKYLIHGH